MFKIVFFFEVKLFFPNIEKINLFLFIFLKLASEFSLTPNEIIF